jgi:sortase (surface protein transpeptidase)
MVGLLLGGLLFFALGACGLVVAARKPGHPATPVGRPQALLPVPRGKRAPVPVPAADDQAAVPVSITIPVIDVRSRLLHLGQTKSGALQVPPVTTVAGWFTGSPRPGDIGSSIIVGHVDSVQGPGIFFRLRLMRPGERVYVRQAGGKVAVFRVTGVRHYLKAAFPASAVYGGTPTAQLRLITCGGHFDQATGHYLSNVVVYATLVR